MSRRITFVVGAGANSRMDPTSTMPVGSELAARIQRQLRFELADGSRFPSGEISGAIDRLPGGMTQDHISAMRRIEEGITSKESIDEFIDEWSNTKLVQDVGKIAIAHQILEAERRTELFKALDSRIAISERLTYARDSWLGLVWRLANPGIPKRDFAESWRGIRFITFNYDRLIELTLFNYANVTLGFEKEDAARFVNAIPIVHAYGSLGALPQLHSGLGIKFGSDPSMSPASAQNIKTFTEECESHVAGQIQLMISESNVVVFLGFGFHERNLKLLFDEDCKLPDGVAVWGTSIGLRPQRKSQIRSILQPQSYPFDLIESECHDLIWNNQDEIFGP